MMTLQPPKSSAAELSAADLYARCKDRVYRIALYYLCDRALAEDVVQEAFIGWLQQRAHTRVDDVEGYLLRSARNLALNQLRARRRESTGLSEYLASTACQRDHGEIPGVSGAEFAVLVSALRRLPPEQRETVELHALMRWTFKEIAALTQTPLNTAIARYHYALKALRKIIAQNQGDGNE